VQKVDLAIYSSTSYFKAGRYVNSNTSKGDAADAGLGRPTRGDEPLTQALLILLTGGTDLAICGGPDPPQAGAGVTGMVAGARCTLAPAAAGSEDRRGVVVGAAVASNGGVAHSTRSASDTARPTVSGTAATWSPPSRGASSAPKRVAVHYNAALAGERANNWPIDRGWLQPRVRDRK
jgi:hypothetical protein